MDSLNRLAIELIDEALEYAEELNIGATDLASGATVLDCGLEFDGGVEAGLLVTEIQTAGLATPQWRLEDVNGVTLPVVEVSTDQAGLSLLCSQKAGWELSTEDFEGLGSGPARALVAEEQEFQTLSYADAFDLTALALETDTMPTEAAVEQVAALTGVEPSGVFLLAYPAASVVGSVTNAARAAELTAVRLLELGYDPRDIVSVTGQAPVPPVAGDEPTAIGRAADAVAYGATVHCTVREPVSTPDAVVSSAASEHARPLAAVFDEQDWDLSTVPASLFGPAELTLDVVGGETTRVGQRSPDILLNSFDLT
ncbi:MAG: methenyltetrahydromethanopterin cyclohydrolase [Natrialbaceae archaeon]|nr:methenyltetrahydromethanopterin cyclohydrolase [Natrialbaceae archaeon]